MSSSKRLFAGLQYAGLQYAGSLFRGVGSEVVTPAPEVVTASVPTTRRGSGGAYSYALYSSSWRKDKAKPPKRKRKKERKEQVIAEVVRREIPAQQPNQREALYSRLRKLDEAFILSHNGRNLAFWESVVG